MNSALLELLEPEEQREILGHELGHIMSGHTTYTTIAIILMTIGFQNLPFLAGVAILPFQLALMEWYRKAELSSDRAGLLSTQDPKTSMSTFLKMAGGRKFDDEISIEEFQKQAKDYETQGNVADRVWQVINTAFRTHPFGTVRAAELQRWIDSGEYDKIVNGDYRRRDDAAKPSLGCRPRGCRRLLWRPGERSHGDNLRRVGSRSRGIRQRVQDVERGEMKVLIVGGGGREHAIAWKLKHDDPSLDLHCTPGNPGIESLAVCHGTLTSNLDGLVTLGIWERFDLTIVGPEAPLAAGLVDRLASRGFRAFGPTAAAAHIESSKRFAKELMLGAGVPTARATWHQDVGFGAGRRPGARCAGRHQGVGPRVRQGRDGLRND